MNESGEEVLAFAWYSLVAVCMQKARSKGIKFIAGFLQIGAGELSVFDDFYI